MKGRKKSYSEKDYDVILNEKKCTDCKKVLNKTEYNIAEVRIRKEDGLRVAYLKSKCKKCQAKIAHKGWMGSERKKEIEEQKNSTTKICKMCGRELEKSLYSTSYKRYDPAEGDIKDYLRPYCKECQNEVYKDQWQKDKERLTSSEHLSENRKNRKKKFFQYRALSFRHHYDAKDIDGRELALFLWHLWRRQRGLCVITGRKLTRENAQVDHIQPRKNGVNNDFSNLQWVVNGVNRAKNHMTPKEFEQFILDIYNTIIN